MSAIATHIEELPIISLLDTSLVVTLATQQIGFIENNPSINSNNLIEQSFSPLEYRNTLEINQSGFDYWSVIKVANTTRFETTWWLEVPGNEVNAWIEHANLEVDTFRTGNLLKQNLKAVPSQFRNFNYLPLQLEPFDTLTVKLNVKTGTFFPIHSGVYKLGRPIYFENWQNNRFGNTSFINGLFGALLMVCCCYCLAYFILTKEIFALFIISYCLTLLGYSYQFNSTWYRLGLSPVFVQILGLVFINISVVIHYAFIRKFLNLAQLLPNYDKLFKYGFYFLATFTLLHAFFYWFGQDYLLTLLLIIIVHSISYIPSILVSFKLLKSSERSIQILVVGILISHLLWLYNNAHFLNISNDLLKVGGMIYVLSIIVSFGFRAAEAQRLKIQTKAERLLDKVKLQELQKLDRLKSTFFANISHELRTPLTLILSPIHSIIKSGELGNRNFILLKKAEQSGKDLIKLTNSILDLTKLEAGKLQLTLSAVHLYPLLKRTLSTFEPLTQERKIRLVFEYHLEKPTILELDEEKLVVVINNLLSNACKFTPSNGSIHLQVYNTSQQIEIKLSDNGAGIHPDDLPHIFNRFYQSKQDNAPVQGGTGIGLALTREYIQLMGGNIQVESQLNKGTTFTILLPLRKVTSLETTETVDKTKTLIDKQPIVQEQPVQIAKGMAKILVAEDNKSMREYLEIILSPYYKVVAVENGAVAWQQLQNSEHQIHLVLSDLMMPIMDGYQLLSQIKSNDKFRHLPCLMLTARADLQDKLKALRIGVDDYLIKPFSEEELLVRIDNLLQNCSNRQNHTVTIEEEETTSPQMSEEDQIWLQEFETVLQRQIDNPDYSISNMAEAFFISESTLNRQLKKLTGLTPARYLRETRLNEARYLIESRKFNSIRQIAITVGFRDEKAFSRSYKKRFGKSPSDDLKF